MVKIPLQKVPSQSFKVRLAGQNCEIRVYYRFGDTYMDLTVNGVQVCSGIICRDRLNVVQITQTVFSGRLFFADMLGDKDPVYTGFGDRFKLFYEATE